VAALAEPQHSGPPPWHTRGYDQARSQLAHLPVKGWDRHSDFARYQFGEPWSDDVNVEFGHNGCHTRDDILRRDLTELVDRPGTCYAQSGVVHDPYTGETIAFVRGPDTSDTCRSIAWSRCRTPGTKGAREWDERRRRDFANDPRNLPAVRGKANFDKAFRDAAAWLPPAPAFRCAFVARLVEVRRPTGCGCRRTRNAPWQRCWTGANAARPTHAVG
jgi:hypothetical protein